ncbi:MAG: thiamine pyrophosphate-binding protein [Candidatus Abyssobacteria bacterium SURF_17]|uniref:Thiamine pyrophosphate-binding protein n=1 Tax=Candidatus Abyssobacteria bacterium SURF_17 TaxID=2093361 RepID=A0A419EUG7_9BACT|nr:MAG: thiamine pyrophosphate-binding protein [Candidatus Abyssubacteria bacterium SURF_17]
MAKISGGALAAQVIKNDGIKYLFGLVGGHIYPIMENCVELGIGVIDVRHEESAAHMAEGWALATGKPSVCMGTAGPGFTNMLTGIANSFAGGTPMLAIGGRASINEFDTGALQDFNQLDVVKPMTKFARAVYQIERIPDYMGMALRHATSGRPGPAYLEVPKDLLFGEIDVASVQIPECHRMQSPPAGNPRDVERALELIAKAKKPVAFAGGGIWWSQAHEELKQFIEKADIPLYTRSSARGSVPDDHPLCLGPGFTLAPNVLNVLAEADLLILLSARFGFTFKAGLIPPNLKMIRVDIEPSEMCAGRAPDVGIVGDVGTVLRQFTDGIKKMSHKEWVEQLRSGREQMRQAFEPLLSSDQKPIHPLRLCREVSKFLDRETIICTDGGDMCVWGNLALPAMGPGLFISQASSIFGCLGVGIPYGIAAKLAKPEKRVIVLTGDGAFGLTLMEFDTALRHNVPFVAVIGNDQCWGMIHRPIQNQKGMTVGCQLAHRRYDKIVEAMGGHGEYVEKPEDIGPAIQRALDSGLPACVNVMTDPEIGPGLGGL